MNNFIDNRVSTTIFLDKNNKPMYGHIWAGLYYSDQINQNKPMKKLLILRGLPASGKSTYAKTLTDYKRVNRDDIRKMLGYSFENYDNQIEAIITGIEHRTVESLLRCGYSVVSDNLNLRQKYVNSLHDIAKKVGDVGVEEQIINTDLETCILRNRIRKDKVPENVIEKLHKDFKSMLNGSEYMRFFYEKSKQETIKQDESLPHCIICDIDGTLALFGDKNPYERDFENDEVNKGIREILGHINEGAWNEGYGVTDPSFKHFIFVSGRNDKFRDVTLKWLENKCWININPDDYTGVHLIMRKDGDYRKDSIIKQEIYDNYIKGKYYVDFVLDDRNQVVDMWRKNGLTCLQVAEGDF